MAYEINYNDSRFQQVNNEKAAALNNVNNTYNQMISNSDRNYQQMIDASKDYANKQQELQQANTDFAIEKINQQKDQAKKDYTKEQTAGYVDYKKATNQYGANSEALASNGMLDTGYAESTKINAFNTYQNRYASARETYNQAVLNYDNSIKEAQLSNNSTLAEIAYNALKTQLEYSLQQFQYKNSLLQAQLEAQRNVDNDYYTRWQGVLSQMNTENSLNESIRQYNESMAFQREQFNYTKAQNAKKSRSKGSSSTKLTNGSSSKKSSSTKLSKGSSDDGWMTSTQMANSLGLPAAVNLSKVISSKEYETKKVNGKTYYKKK